MTYDEAMAFIEETKRYGSRPGLANIRALMRELGDAEERVPVVHIGGTNGKGSVGAALSSVLTQAGYRVGWFATPDVFSYEEEFRMNGEPIARERLAEILTEVRSACERLMDTGPADSAPRPTRFEVETAAAFLWFYEEHCDLALVEVGMGGALDATNLITKPLVSVLTPIGMDHMAFLGDTLSEIAAAKAGIIKSGCPVVTAPQEPEALDVIRARCQATKSKLYYSDRDSNFMRENARCAEKTLEVLRACYPERFAALTDEHIAAGLAEICWPGRYDARHPFGADGPTLVLDGAHNPAAARRLREALDADFPGVSFSYIMGVLADKDADAIADAMLRPGDRVYTVASADPRALPAQDLACRLSRHPVTPIPCATVRDAVSDAKNEAADVMVAFGSLSYLGELVQALPTP